MSNENVTSIDPGMDESYKESKRREEEFRKFFELPDDILHDDFSCALQKGAAFVQGRFYISDKHVCFGSIFNVKKKISYEDITSIHKRTTAVIFSNALEICTTEENYFFTSFLFRDNAFNLLAKTIRKYNNIYKESDESLDAEDIYFDDKLKQTARQKSTPKEGTKTKSVIIDQNIKKPKPTESDYPSDTQNRRAINDTIDPPSEEQISTDTNGTTENTENGNRVTESSTTSPGTRRKNSESTDAIEDNEITDDLDGSTNNDPGKDIPENLPDPKFGKSDDLSNIKSLKLKEKEHDDEIEEEIEESESPSSILPPFSDTHPLFNDAIPRAHLVEREISVTLLEFWYACWSGRTMMVEDFLAKTEHVDAFYGDWMVPQTSGCWERMATWTVPLRGYAIGPSKTQIEQKQRARLKNPNLLEIEISSVSKNIPFAEDFTWEERWTITTINPKSIKVCIDGSNYWHHVAWGAGMLKGTINKTSAEVGKQKNELFIDLAESYINSNRTKISQELSRTRRLPSRNRTLNIAPSQRQPRIIKQDIEQSQPPRDLGTKKEIKTIQNEQRNIFPEVKSSGQTIAIVDKISSKYSISPQNINFILFGAILGTLILIFIPMLYSLSSRIAALEKQIELTTLTDSATEKVAFLEYFIHHLTKNLTGNIDTVSNYYELWKNTHNLEKRLENWKHEIDIMQDMLRIDKKETLEFTYQHGGPPFGRPSSTEEGGRWFWYLIMGIVVVFVYVYRVKATEFLKKIYNQMKME